MQTNLPKEFWVDREALVRPQICSHISKRDEFEPGVRCYVADLFDNEVLVWIGIAVIAGMVNASVLMLIVRYA